VSLFLISSAVWLGLGFLLTSILLPDYTDYPESFLNILPARIVFSLLIYAVSVLAYYLLLIRDKLNAQKQIVEEKAASVPLPVEKLSRVIVKKNSEFHCINVNQIRYIEANGDYVLIYTESARYLKDHPMKYWEMHLPDDYFVRIHRSFIVNIEMIAKIELYEKETYKVHLKNGDMLKASISGYKLLRQKMKI
jgi:DNA-binding LytR/AlgR family response regulator